MTTFADPEATAGEESAPARAAAAPLQTRGRERYDILAEHGRGGLGVVKRALDTELQRPVAIKELLRRGDYLEARFVREALITARLEHPGIVPVHEAGRWPDGTPYYAMKLVSGRPLSALLDRARTPADRLGLLSHVIAVADAIAYAHDLHVIHRDLKPSNVIVGDFGETVVIDWGLAKDLGAPDSDEIAVGIAPAAGDLTAIGSVMGTPAYMAPEQADGARVDARADVFALGAILFELVVGRPPGADAADPGVLGRELARARTPSDLQAIIVKALAWEPHHRYPSAGPLADDLRRYDRGARVAAHHYTWHALVARFARRHRVLVALSLAFAAVLTAGAILSVRRIRSERDLAVAAEAAATAERNRVIRIHAESALATDPTSTMAWLKRLPEADLETAESRQIALRARALGVATAVLEHGAPVPYIAFTPDGSRLVACGSGTLTLWSRDSARLRSARGECFSTLPVSSDGSRVYVSAAPGGLGEWHLDTGESRVAYPSRLLVDPILTASDGTLVAGLSDGTAVRGATGTAPSPLRWPVAARPRALSATGRWLAAVDAAGDAWLTDLRTERQVHVSHGPAIRQVRFTDDDRIAIVVHEDGSIGSLDLDEPAPREAPWNAPPTTWLSVGGRVAALVHRSATVSLWDVRARAHLADISRVAGPSMTRVSPDEAWIAVGSKSGPALLYERATARSVHLLGHRGRITDIRFQPGGSLVATASSDGTVRLWRLPDPGHRVVGSSAGLVSQLAVSPGGAQVAAAVEGGALPLFSLQDGATARLPGHTQAVTALAYAPSGAHLASRSVDLRAVISDPRPGRFASRDLGGAINDVAFAPDETRVAIASTDGSIAIENLDGSDRVVLGRHLDEAWRVRFLDAATVISAGKDGEVAAWDLRDHRRSTLYRHDGGVLFMASAPGPRLVTAGADSTVVVWSRSGQERISTGRRPRALAISPAGTRWMVADATGSIRIGRLDAAAGQAPRVIRYPAPINGLCFLDEETFVGASDDGAVLSWRGDADLLDIRMTDTSGNTAVACRGSGGSTPEVVTATRDGKVVAGPVAKRGTAGSVRALLDLATTYQLSTEDDREEAPPSARD